MGWLDKLKLRRKEKPSDLWRKCPSCDETLLVKDLTKNMYICSKCTCHLRMPIWDRIALLTDENSFIELFPDLVSEDPLNFVDSKPYRDRIREAIEKTDSNEAITVGKATIGGMRVFISVMNFEFMGGSMGSVVGEKFTAIAEMALEEGRPLISIATSGGARMQEGIISLMQMAKTSAVIDKLYKAGVLFISILIDPTAGGVSASFASLGDINISEPGAFIGFAGPRVIEQTIRQKLPEGFQRSNFLIEHGMLDIVVHRSMMKNTLERILRLIAPDTAYDS